MKTQHWGQEEALGQQRSQVRPKEEITSKLPNAKCVAVGGGEKREKTPEVRDTLFTAWKVGWMPNGDSRLSTHSTPWAQLILSLLSFSPLFINVLKYLFIWMFVTLFWPSSSFWCYIGWAPAKTVTLCQLGKWSHWRGKVFCLLQRQNWQSLLLLSRHPHLRETDLAGNTAM